jgi:hypothetical protein
MGGQQKNFISDIVFFQRQDGMRKKFDGIFYSVQSLCLLVVLISFRWVKCIGVGMIPNLVLNEDEKKVLQYNIINCNSYSEICTRVAYLNPQRSAIF